MHQRELITQTLVVVAALAALVLITSCDRPNPNSHPDGSPRGLVTSN